MSRKKHRGKGGSPHSDSSGTVRKQKAAKFAEKNLKPTSENSPLGNSESEDLAEDTPLEDFKDNADSGKRKNKKRNADNNILTENTSEPQDERRLKKAAAMRQAAEKNIGESRTADNSNSDTESVDGISESDKEKNAKRMKKAEYIKQETEMLIAADMAKPTDEECSDNVSDEQENAEVPEEAAYSETESLPSDERECEFDNSELKEAFIKKYAAEQFEKNKSKSGKDFYEILIDPTADGIANNVWDVPLPVVGESEENGNE